MNYTATVWSWFGEKKYYDYDTQVCSGKTCGHYTQVNSNWTPPDEYSLFSFVSSLCGLTASFLDVDIITVIVL